MKVREVIRRWFLRAKARVKAEPIVTYAVGFSEHEVFVTSDRVDEVGVRREHLLWSDLVKVRAFKQDLYAVDRICIVMDGASEQSLSFHEEMPGYPELVEALPDRLAGCLPFEDWFISVAVPAFEPNLTVLWERPAGLEPGSVTP